MKYAEIEPVFTAIIHPSSPWEVKFCYLPLVFPFNIAVEALIEIILSSCQSIGIGICSNRKI